MTRCFLSALSQVCGVHLITSPVPATQLQVRHESTVSGVLCLPSGKLISACDTPHRCQLSRIPGRHG